MGSLGTVSAGSDSGGASYMYDEEVPQAYEQMSDAQTQLLLTELVTIGDTNMLSFITHLHLDLGGVTVLSLT